MKVFIPIILSIFLCLPYLSFTQNIIIPADCQKFKKGTFTTRYGVLVKRKKHIQKEVWIDANGQKNKIWYRVEWIDDCSYTLKFIHSNRKKIREEHKKHGGKLVVQITSSKTNSYSYQARWFSEMTWEFTNTLAVVQPSSKQDDSTDEISID